MSPIVAVVDVGISNTASVLNALHYLGAAARATDDPADVASAELVVLPGVGSFPRAMERLHGAGLASAITEVGRSSDRKVLGICLGMQLLGELGSEDGVTPGLGLIGARAEAFTPQEVEGLKVPHVGFNSVTPAPASRLLAGLGEQPDFYFVHSYRMLPAGLPGRVSTCLYGIDFVAAYEDGSVFATQFHPEKSQANGLQLLTNFLDA